MFNNKKSSLLESVFICIILIFISAEAGAFEMETSANRYTTYLSNTVNFNCTPKGGQGPYKFSWNFDDVDSYKNGMSTSQNPSHTFKHLGEHHVTVDVTDANGDSSKSVLTIDVRIASSTKTINVIKDCGSYNLDNDGSSNVGADLKQCVANNYNSSGGLRLYFPKGTYRFDDQSLGDYKIGFALSKEKLEFVGDGPGKTVLSFYNNSTSKTKTHGDFFRAARSTASWWLWKNMTLRLDLNARGGSIENFDRRQFLLSGTDSNSIKRRCMFEDVDIENFSSVVYWGGFLTMKRCNVTGFGRGKDKDGDSKPFTAAVDYGDNSLLRWTYWSNGAMDHSHIFYPQNARYTYVVENFANMKNSVPNKLIGQLKKAMQDSSYNGNLGMNVKSAEGIQWGHNDCIAERIEMNDNRFQNVGGEPMKIINTIGAVVKRNFSASTNRPLVTAQNGSGDCDDASNCRSADIVIKDNTYGYDTSFTKFSVTNDSSSIDVTDTGGENTNDKHMPSDPEGWHDGDEYDDPGKFEFAPPSYAGLDIIGSGNDVQLNLGATDSGSGMGSKARFPFRYGALMQFSNDGVKWSEVRPYKTTTDWKLNGNSVVYAKFRDRDGNWSDIISSDGSLVLLPDPEPDPDEGSHEAPQRLRVVNSN